MKRLIRTWRVGEVGTEGTRRVEPGGFITFCGRRYYHDNLLNHVGEIVYFHDDDGDIAHDGDGRFRLSVMVYVAHWHANGGVSAQSGGRHSEDGGVTWTETPTIGRAYEREHNDAPKYRQHKSRRAEFRREIGLSRRAPTGKIERE